ncbi:hypothetical protein CTI12_AA531610 [Artemisia annua]|uniref:CCHC-type domain-containing protein n=1 Tax=Artemisia annua TaxID=35608 RepID=A0A2U1L436_ARTAN|nr:hypothetical protein CTI12_AA531610 [Artemisia annua]
MERNFDSWEFTEPQMVKYAIRMLDGEALEWWNSIMTKYYGPGAVRRIEREFISLQNGNISIDKYNTAFTEKLQFAMRLCPHEKSKVDRYVQGLPYEYRIAVRIRNTLEEAMDASKVVEDDLIAKDGKSVGCRRCGKMGYIMRDCTSTEVLCYNRKEMGHIAIDCPKKKTGGAIGTKKADLYKPKGRALHMIVEEKDDDEVITGTFLVNSLPPSVLFDSGANRSFVSFDFVRHLVSHVAI